MKKLFLFCIALVASIAGKAGVLQLADPTIFFDNGVYYLTGTYAGSGFAMYSSTDLIHWSPCGNANGGLALHKDDTFGTAGFWAPQIFKYGDSYYMAYTANELIAIAKADSPMGPFRQEEQQELPHTTGQIDPFVFIDDDGKKYLYYVRFDGGNTLYVNELTDDFRSFKPGTLKKCLGAEDGWELTGEYSSARITEGPTVFKDGGYYYLLYSANDYHDINYAVGYAYSTSPTGPWTKTGRPFLSRHNIGINGTGHGDLFQDAEGNWFYVFHVHKSNTEVQTRRTALVPITITDDPANKFVPQADRMVILTDNAGSNETIPGHATAFEADGIKYSVANKAKKLVQVDFKDPVLFGGYEGEVTIPGTVEYDGEEYTVSAIGTSAFYNCPDLKRVNLPEGLMKLGYGSFESSGIRSIEVPGSITSMGTLTFRNCKSLLDVVMNKVTAPNIGESLFHESTYSNGKLWIPEEAVESYTNHGVWKKFRRISGADTSAPKYSFCADGLYYNILSDDDATVSVGSRDKQWASYGSAEIVIPAAVEHDGRTYSVTAIDVGCFRDCRLVKHVAIPEGVTTLGTSCFYNCFELDGVTLPSTVTELGTTVFRYCYSLSTLTCLAPEPPKANSADFSTEALAGTLFVPFGTKGLYAAATGWKAFQNIVELEDTAIDNAQCTMHNAQRNGATYNLAGQRVGTGYKGIVIRNGRKIVQ